MPNKVGGRKGVRNGFAERMPLQEFQMSLLASLPAGNGLKRVDVPADQLCKSGCSLLDTNQGCRVFERDLAVLGPAQGCGAMRKRSAFPVQDCPLAAQPDDGCVARCTVRLFCVL